MDLIEIVSGCSRVKGEKAMRNTSVKPVSSLLDCFTTLRKPISGLMLTLGLVVSSLSSLPAIVSATPLPQAKGTSPSVTRKNSFPADGIYLYGQSQRPDQLGQSYLVFEVRQKKVLGAFYMPSSSFDCFYGAMQPGQLALTVVDSYERTANSYAIALERTAPIASATNPAITGIDLKGYYPIAKVSENDRRILGTCRTEYQNQVWK